SATSSTSSTRTRAAIPHLSTSSRSRDTCARSRSIRWRSRRTGRSSPIPTPIPTIPRRRPASTTSRARPRPPPRRERPTTNGEGAPPLDRPGARRRGRGQRGMDRPARHGARGRSVRQRGGGAEGRGTPRGGPAAHRPRPPRPAAPGIGGRPPRPVRLRGASAHPAPAAHAQRSAGGGDPPSGDRSHSAASTPPQHQVHWRFRREEGAQGRGIDDGPQGGAHGPGGRSGGEPLPHRQDRPRVGGRPGRGLGAGAPDPAQGELMSESVGGRRSPSRSRAAWAVVLLALVFETGCAARWAYRQGQGEAKKGNWDLAVARFTRALQKDPDNISFKIALENARIQASRLHYDLGKRHLLAEELDKAVEELQIAANYDPANKSASDDLAIVQARIRNRDLERRRLSEYDTIKARAQAGPGPLPVLSPQSNAPISIKFENTSLQKILETMGRLAGVNVLFDSQYRDKTVSVDLRNETFQNALDRLTFVNRLFYKILDPSTIIVVDESAAKRRT